MLTDEAGPRQRVRLDVSYDGTDFSGWAVQPGRRTVQGVLQDALGRLLRREIGLTVAGRTDAGVHAEGQVAHLDLDAVIWSHWEPRLVHALAGVLPPDVRVLAATAVPAEFDARFSALWRRYEYRLGDGDSGVPPLLRHQVAPSKRRLDVAAMTVAAGALLGLHDFAAFCRFRAGSTTIRTLQQFDVVRDGDLITCTVRADAFCHSMVRSLVGALIAVGEGRRAPDWPAGLFARVARADEVGVAPALGLTLVEVGYPAQAELAARAEQTRARRAMIDLTSIEPSGGLG